MSRIKEPIFKRSRRLGFSILNSEKEFEKGKKRTTIPGQHGGKRQRPPSAFALQLSEKQKLRFTYQVNEKQFRKIYDRSTKMPGEQGLNFLILLESRLDNAVYRGGVARTRRASRQLVNHKLVYVNGKRVNIPSYRLKIGDVITFKEKLKSNEHVISALEAPTWRAGHYTWNEKEFSIKYTEVPKREEVSNGIDTNLIIKFYNK